MKKIKYKHHPENLKTTITVFQALTLLAEKYRGDPTRAKQIDLLYLSGVRNPADQIQLNVLLQDDLFEDYIISRKKRDINDDPVRRYFESHLCYETLINTLDALDSSLLSIFNEQLIDAGSHLINLKLGTKRTQIIQRHISINQRSALMLQRINPGKVNEENMTAIDKQTFKSRIQKIITLHACYTATPGGDMAFLATDKLNLFKEENSIYSATARGRITRVDRDYYGKQTVSSYHLGIMKAFMPLPQYDPLYFPQNTNYVRHADRTTYIDGALQVELAFFNQVTPFSNSISGDMLRHLILIDRLHQKTKFYYADNEEQLKLYFKNYIALGIYLMGCHSLNEFMSVLQLPEVQYTFRKISTFSDLTLNKLFKDENRTAFHHALLKTIEYNERIISQKKTHQHLAQITEQNAQLVLDKTLNVKQGITNSQDSDCNIKPLVTPTDFFNFISQGLNQLIAFTIQQGQDVNLMHKNRTPLDHALLSHQWIAAVLLMKAGATAKYKHAFVIEKLRIYLHAYDLENIKLILASQHPLNELFHNNQVIKYIHKLAKYDKLEIIQCLIGAGLSINQRYKDGRTLAMVAAKHGAEATLHFLINNHADTKIGICTALHIAALYQQAKCCRLLINAGSSLDAIDDKGNTPEYYAQKEAMLVFQATETIYKHVQERLAKHAWSSATDLVISQQHDKKLLVQCIGLISSKHPELMDALKSQLNRKNKRLCRKKHIPIVTLISSTSNENKSALISGSFFKPPHDENDTIDDQMMMNSAFGRGSNTIRKWISNHR